MQLVVRATGRRGGLLGVAWQQVHEGMADIAGFSPDLLRHYSTRRQEIEEAVERHVAETGKEAHPRVYQKFTLETRQPKAYPRGEAAVTQEIKDYGITTDIVDHWHQLAITAPEDVEAVVRNSVGVATPPLETGWVVSVVGDTDRGRDGGPAGGVHRTGPPPRSRRFPARRCYSE